MADSGYKSISRIDIPNRRTHGYQVRVWFNQRMYNKFFNDNHYANREEVLQAAVEYRNELEKQLGKPRTKRPVVTNSPRNNTGVIGVNKTLRKSKKKTPDNKPQYYEVYEVTWHPKPNKVEKRIFSFSRYGEEEAFRRAVEHRRAMEKKYYW